jgi:hypothetical protein
LHTATIAARCCGMKPNENKPDRKPIANSDNLTQLYEELLKLRRKVQSLQKNSKQTKPH